MRGQSTTLALLASAVLLAIAGAVMFVLRQASDPPSRDSPAEERRRTAAPPETKTPLPESAGARTAVPTSEDEAPPVAALTVRGRVVDAGGSPLPEIEVGIAVEDGEPPITARSDGAGSFQLAASELPCSIVVVDPKWTTLRSGEVTEGAPLVPALVVAVRAVSVSGIVVDPQGRPLAGAQLGIRVERSDWTAEADVQGGFTFARAPAVAAARLSTRLAEFRTDVRTLDLPPPSPLRIVLVPELPEGPVLTGKVVRSDGSSVSGAMVSFGSARARSDIAGRFRLVCGYFNDATPLVAAAQRGSPAVLVGFGSQVECSPAQQPPQTLVLPHDALSIGGSVRHPDGRPAKGWRVALVDTTPLDPGGVSNDSVEGLAARRTEMRTDASGAFELGGLIDREYTLVAYGRDRASRAEVVVGSKPVWAGSRDVVFSASDGSAGASIQGRVLTTSGNPVADARIGLGRPARRGSAAEFGMMGRFRTVSDARGQFEIPGVPGGIAFLVASREGFLPNRLVLDADEPRADLIVRLRERRELSFDGSAASPVPDLLLLLPASWEFGSPSRRLDGGISGAIPVDAGVREIVLYRGCRELARLPLELAPEGTTRVVWP